MKKNIGSAVPRRGGASLWRKATAVALSCLLIAPASGIVAFGEPAGGQESAPAATKEAADAAGVTPAAADVTGTRAADEVGTAAGAGVGDAAGTADAVGVGTADAAGVRGDSLAAGAEASGGAADPNETPANGTLPSTGDAAELERCGVFPAESAEADNNLKWVVYDTGDAHTASIKATITLQNPADPNHHPFLREITSSDDSPHYPTPDQVKTAIGGEYNDYKVYMIHWVEIKDGEFENGKVESGTYNLETKMEVSPNRNMAVKLEYVNQKSHPDAQLKGKAGERKLRVFSSKDLETVDLEEMHEAAENVGLGDEGYKYFSFNVTKPCPYVLVSKKLAKGYVSQLAIESIFDGSAPFDKTGNLKSGAVGSIDVPGNDASKNNRVVRSYDTVQYNLAATFGARQSGVTATEVDVYFELTLRKSATAARFDISKMLWLQRGVSR